MSRWLSEQVRVGLASDRVDTVRIHRGWRARVLDTQSAACAPAAAQSWQTIADALRRLPPAMSSNARTSRCSVVLGNRWVRYQVLPWQDGLASEQEHAACAAMHMQTVYGGLADAWQVAFGAPRYGRPTLVCAVDAALLAQLRAWAAERHLRLSSVRPLLTSVLARWRSVLPKRDSWLAVIEGERICLARLSHGRPLSVSVQSAQGGVVAAMWAMIRRESIETAQPAHEWPIDVFAPDASPDVLAELRGRTSDERHERNELRVFDAADYLTPLGCDSRAALALN